MLMLNVFLSESSFMLYRLGKKYVAEDRFIFNKYYKLQTAINTSRVDAEKWHYVNTFCDSLYNLNDDDMTVFAKRWKEISNLMTAKGSESIEMHDKVIFAELSPKITVVIFPNNSALHVRKIAGSTVFTTARINNIYDDQNATKILYQASEASAYDVIKRIRKIAENARLENIELEEDMEGV
jgi:hypothetical protein